jgi:nitroreductase
MNFLDLVLNRYSVRAYQPLEVEQEKIDQILQAVRMAPTAANRQPFRLILIRTKGREAELRRIYNKDWFVQAPIVFCACGVDSESWIREDGRPITEIDVAIVMDHLTLAAASLGLGTCWIGAFDSAEARKILEIPDSATPILFSPLGYPADQPKIKERRPIEALVKYEHW